MEQMENKNKFCMYCGTPLDSDWSFCMKCGNKIQKEESPVKEVLEDEEITPNIMEDETIDNTIEEENEEMIYSVQRDHLVDLYNRMAKRNSITLVNLFLPLFILVILTVKATFLLLGILLLLGGFLALTMIITNKSYKRTVDLLSLGLSKIEIYDDYFIIENKFEENFEHSFIKYEDILTLEENEHVFVFNTKMNKIYVVEKSVLKEELDTFRNKLLRNINIYNGVKIKKELIEQGRYDYYPETKTTISIMAAKEKSVHASILTLVSFAIAFIIAFSSTGKEWLVLAFLPVGMADFIYNIKLNKRVQGNFKIVGEKVIAIVLTALTLFVGLFSLSFLL